jgi:hypothetical protein
MGYYEMNAIFLKYGWKINAQLSRQLLKTNEKPITEYNYINPEYPNDEFSIIIDNIDSNNISISVPMPRSNFLYKNKIDIAAFSVENYIEEHLKNYQEKMLNY